MYIAVLADPDAIDAARESTGQNIILYFSEIDLAMRAISKHRIKLLFVTSSSVDMGYLNRRLKMLSFWVRMVLISRNRNYYFMFKSRNESMINTSTM